MNAQEIIQRAYTVTVHPVVETADSYRVSYVPRGSNQEKRLGATKKHAPDFKATAAIQGDQVLVNWAKAPSDAEATQKDFDEDLRGRVKALHKWIEQLDDLVGHVHKWAEEFGWAARRVYKPMSDTEIGDYKAPGLVLQRDMTRVGLEPVGRAASDIQGYVDLYVLPAYDDIAGLFFYDNRWHLSHPGRTSEAVEDKLFTKKAFRELLDQMTTNGG